MKQRLSLFLLLMAMAVGQATAANWPLQIAGIQVTDDNHDNVTGTAIYAFDASKPYKVWVEKNGTYYEVYLKNAFIDGGSGSGVYSNNNYLKVIIESDEDDQSLIKGGTAAINHQGTSQLYVEGAEDGKGVLHLEASKGTAVIGFGDIELSGKISAKATNLAFRGSKDNTLITLCNSLEMYADGGVAVFGYCHNITDKTNPKVVNFKSHDTYGTTAYDSDGNVLKKLCCGGVEDYYIDVAGIHVTSLNNKDIMAPGITIIDPEIDSKMLFDINRLYLGNMRIDVTGKNINAIDIERESLIICHGYYYERGARRASSIILSDKNGISMTSGEGELTFTSYDASVTCTIEAGEHAIYAPIDTIYLWANTPLNLKSTKSCLEGDTEKTILEMHTYASSIHATSPAGAIKGFKEITNIPDEGNAEFATADDGNGWAARNADGTLMTEVYVGIAIYPFTVAGNLVTELNRGNITGPGISALDSEKPYSVVYDPKSTTLELNNVLIVVTGTWLCGIHLDDVNANNLTVTGNGQIKSDVYGISCYKGQLSVSGTDQGISIDAGDVGIYADQLTLRGKLQIKSKTTAILAEGELGVYDDLMLQADGVKTAIKGVEELKNLGTGDVEILAPANVSLADSDKDDIGYCARLADGTPVSGLLTIAKAYPVWVAGHHLSVFDDLEGGIEADGIKGKVTYNPKERLLTLEDATITANTEASPTGIILKQHDDSGIFSTAILLKGNNTITAKKAGINFDSTYKNFTIYGEQGKGGDIPQLTIHSQGDGVTATNGEYTIYFNNDLQLNIYAADAAINGNGKAEVNFSGNSKASLYGEKYSAVSRVGDLVLNGIEIASLTKMETVDYYGDGSKTLIVKDSYLPATSVELRRLQYYVAVADVVVSELNELQPIESDHIKGSVRFDKAEGTLTLTNATIDYPEGSGIVIPDMSNIKQIKVEGTNTIVTDGLGAGGLGLICEDLPLTISGPGSLKVQTILVGDLTIKDCTISNALISVPGGGQLSIVNSTLQNGFLWVVSDDGHSGTVDITNSTVMADVPAFFKAWGLEADKEYSAIENDGDITITNSYMEAVGTMYAYDGTGNDASTLTIDNSTVKLAVSGDDAKGTAKGYNLTLKGDVELTGKGSEFNLIENPGTKAFEVRDYGTANITKKAVAFEVPPYYKSYGITIGATTVNGLNYTDVKDESIKGGKVSYDEKTRTLTLDNARIEDASITIPASTAGKLLLTGDNSLSGAGVTGVAIDAADLLTITSADGEGTLAIDGANVVTALNMAGGLNVQTCDVTATAPAGAAMILYDHELTINNALMKLTGEKSGAILSMRDLLGDAYMSAPEGAYKDSSTGHVMIDVDEKPQLVLTTLTIESDYVFRVGETGITRSNYRDVKDDVVKAGKVSYEPATKTLTLDNATLQGPEYGACISAYSWDGIPATVMLEGDNTIKDAGMAIGSSKLVVTSADGNGKLTITAGNGFEAETVTVKDCSVEMTVEDSGIMAYSSGTVTVDNGNLSITCTDKESGMAMRAGKLQLEGGSTLVSPKGAAINTESDALELDGKIVADLVISSVAPGDANGDGTVDIVDVTITISYILGQNPTGFNKEAANVNGDEEVNIVDVTSIIDMILKK